MPSMRIDSGCVVSKAPMPMSVVTTGMPKLDRELAQRGRAIGVITPPPA